MTKTLDPFDRWTVSTTPDGRECLPVLSGGSETGYAPVNGPHGTVRVGYLTPDGTEAGLLDTEYAWVRPADLTPVRRHRDAPPAAQVPQTPRA